MGADEIRPLRPPWGPRGRGGNGWSRAEAVEVAGRGGTEVHPTGSAGKLSVGLLEREETDFLPKWRGKSVTQ